MIPVEDLLKPVSDQQPCGPDLSYDPRLQQLETLVQGTPESQVGDVVRAAEEPDWKVMKKLALEVAKESKHLNVGILLTLCDLKLEGMGGFRDGLNYLSALLKQYWPKVYPALDPDDNNDPTQRINILNSLSAPMGTFGDPYRFIERLSSLTLGGSSRSGRVSLQDIRVARGSAPAPAGKPAMEEGQIAAAFKDTSPDVLKVTYEAIAQSLAKVEEIDAYLTETVGADKATNFDEAIKTLKDMEKSVAAFMEGGTGGLGGTGEGGAGGPAAGGLAGGAPLAGGGVAIGGAIQSRADVVRTLEAICDFYRLYEPSSPLPLLLRRAQRLANMNFMDIVSDLTPDALERLKIIAGTEPAAAAETPPPQQSS